MAKQKKKIEYFDFYCEIGKTTKRFIKEFGLEGFGIWCRLLQELGNVDDQYIVLNSELLCKEFEEETGLPLNKVIPIMDYFCKTSTDFNTDLWLNYRIIRNDLLINKLDRLYKKRKEQPKTVDKIKSEHPKIKSQTKIEIESKKQIKTKIERKDLDLEKDLDLDSEKESDRELELDIELEENPEQDAECKPSATIPQHSDAESKIPSKSMFSDEILELVKSKKDEEFSKWFFQYFKEVCFPIKVRDVEGAFLQYNTKVKNQPKLTTSKDLDDLPL